MSNYPDDYDYYEPEPSEFDEAVEEFKSLLRGEVKSEVKTELETLRKSNTELRNKVKNLSALEHEAKHAKSKYEMEVERAKTEARREVRTLAASELLKAISTPKFSVASSYVHAPKCDKCDESRRFHFTSPLGKETYESCNCSTGKTVYEVVELEVLEIGTSRGEYTLWYTPSTRRDRERHSDAGVYGRVYKRPESLEKMVEHSHLDYGFDTREEAQALADAINKDRTKDAS